jgi:hypothetical protein
MGSEAKELLSKMEQVIGIAPPADKDKEIWEVENWGKDEWIEQAVAEIAFSKAMNVKCSLEPGNLRGSVAGYRVRRAPNGLVLVPSDSEEDIFVAVRVERTKRKAVALGWLRGSEGKVSQFYQKELLGHSPRGLARHGRTPRQRTAPGNATISRAAALRALRQVGAVCEVIRRVPLVQIAQTRLLVVCLEEVRRIRETAQHDAHSPRNLIWWRCDQHPTG